MQPENGGLPLVERADEEGAEHDDGCEVIAVATSWRLTSADVTPVIEPNRKRLRSPAAGLLLLMITTAALRKPTKRMPIEASSGSGDASARC